MENAKRQKAALSAMGQADDILFAAMQALDVCGNADDARLYDAMQAARIALAAHVPGNGWLIDLKGE